VNIGVLAPDGTERRRMLVETPATERNVVISPDNRWIAFESDRTGRNEVYVRPFPEAQGGERPITRDGGAAPLWSRDGKELFYWRQRGNTVSIMSVPVVAGPNFSFSEPRPLFSGVYANPIFDRQYDVGPDGRFVMLKAVDLVPRDEVVVVQNWTEELKRLMPAE
jgi:serine/threonine-protein kinase